MQKEINVLYLKDIGGFLKNEHIKYIVTKTEEEFKIREIPTVFNYHLATLYNYLAYDYDNLSSLNKNLYEKKQKKLVFKINIYSNKIKQYTKKRK